MNIVREGVLGEGGMGVVYRVLDQRLRRRAALKVAKGAANDAARLARFQREALITAKLDHPGVPPVYDAGRTPEGEPFLLMRFVDGEALDALLVSAERPPRHELLAILVKVCEAVAYAHSKRIVHRDLKPANVMVGRFGEVLVLDWGIARDLDQPAADDAAIGAPSAGATVTQAGAILGTFGYMAPEQCRGEPIDERADVFALGAILVELLTGEPPVTGDDVYQLVAKTSAGHVATPRLRDRSVPVELDEIARRALALERERRYPTATALAADLRAFLEGRPVSVHRYGPVDRSLRAARRHPTLVVATLLATAAALLLSWKNRELGRTLASLETEKQERAKATSEKETAEGARLSLQRAWALSRQGAPQAEIARLVSTALAASRTEDLLFEAGKLLVATGDLAGGRRLLRACADDFPPGYAALHALHDTEVTDPANPYTPALRELATRARARHETNAYAAILDGYDAIARGDRAAALAAAERARTLAPRLAEAWVWKARTHVWTKDLEGALASAERAVALEPGSVSALLARGDVHLERKEVDLALADFDRAVTLAPGSPPVWNERGNARVTKGDFAGAIADYTHALELEPRATILLSNRANARRCGKDFDGAIADYTLAIEREPLRAAHWLDRGETKLVKGDLGGAIEDFDAIIEKNPDHADALASRGRAKVRIGDEAGGMADFERALAVAPRHAAAHFARGEARELEGSLALAIDDYTVVIEVTPEDAMAWASRGTCRVRQGDVDGGLEDLDRALAVDDRCAKAHYMRAYALSTRGDVKAAIAEASRTVELDPGYADAWFNLGLLRLRTSDEKRAIAAFDRAIELRLPGASVWFQRGKAHFARKDWVKAISDASRALEIEPDMPDALVLRGYAERKKSQNGEARHDLERFLEVAPKDHPERAKAEEKLAEMNR